MIKSIVAMLALLSVPVIQADTVKAEKVPLHAAVFNFTEGSKEYEGKGESIGKLLNAFLSTKEGIYLVERAEIEKLLSEQELSLSSQIDTSSSIKVGAITGAEILVSGRVFGAGKKTYLVAKIISTETSKVFGATATYSNDDDLDVAVSSLTDKIATVIEKKGAVLRAKKETHEELIERLKKGLTVTDLKIYVHIPEKHLSRPVPDPACQTEIQKILKDCGFQLAQFLIQGAIASEQ